MREFYYPDVLMPNIVSSRADIGASRQAAFARNAAVLRPSQVHSSLSGFMEENQCRLSDLIGRFAKPGLNPERYVMDAVYGKGSVRSGWTGEGYNDGRYSIRLGCLFENKHQPLMVGLLSFSVGYDLKTYFHEVANCPKLMADVPTVVQLQGPSKICFEEKSDYLKAKDSLADLRWEKLLLGYALGWAQYVGWNGMYLLPAKINNYFGQFGQDHDSRLRRRYDGTARHFGFRMQGNGLWGIPIFQDVDSSEENSNRLY